MSHVIFDDYLAKRKDVPDSELYKPNRVRDKVKVIIYFCHYVESTGLKFQTNPLNFILL